MKIFSLVRIVFFFILTFNSETSCLSDTTLLKYLICSGNKTENSLGTIEIIQPYEIQKYNETQNRIKFRVSTNNPQTKSPLQYIQPQRFEPPKSQEDIAEVIVKNYNWSGWSLSTNIPRRYDWSPSEIDRIFQQYDLYKYKQFRDYLCTLDNGERFFKLHEKVYRSNLDPEIKDFVAEKTNEYIQKKSDRFYHENIEPKIIKEYENKSIQYQHPNGDGDDDDDEQIDYEEQVEQNLEFDEEVPSILQDFQNERLRIVNSKDQQSFDKSYDIKTDSKNILEKFDLDPTQLNHCLGNNLQQQLHKESLIIVDESAQLYKTDSQEIKDISEIALTQGYSACISNKEGQVNLGFRYADAGHCVIAFAKGIKEAAKDNVNAICELIKHPVNTVAELGKNVVFAFYKLAKTAVVFYFAPSLNDLSIFASLETIERQTKYRQACLDYHFKEDIEQIKNISENIKNLNPEQACIASGYIITDLLLPKYGIPFIKKVAKSAKKSNQLKKLGAVGKETAHVIGFGLKKGLDKVSGGIEAVKKYPHFIKNFPTVAKAIEHATECVENFDNYLDLVHKSIKRRINDSKHNKLFDDLHLSTAFVPALLNNMPVLQENSNEFCKIADVLGNQWEIYKKTGKVTQLQFSKLGEKTIGWMQQTKNSRASNIEQLLADLKVSRINIPYLKNLDKDIIKLKDKFKNFSLKVGKLEDVTVNDFNFEHFLTMDIKTYKKGIKKPTGFHHDFKQYIEKNQLIKLVSKEIYPHGFYQAKVILHGEIQKKTFFPSHWTREQVVDKIIESLKNYDKKPELSKNGYYVIESTISEKTKIRNIINKEGKVITSYPTFENKM